MTEFILDRKVGIEIEVSEADDNSDVPTNNRYWYKGYDPSVKRCGREFRFNRAYNGENVISAVDNLCQYINAGDRKTDGVNAGFHLHLDYSMYPDSDKKEYALRLLESAVSIKKWINPLVASSRLGSRYCRNYEVTPTTIHNRATSLGRPQNRLVYFDKYLWISPNPLYSLGTIEIRLHESTGDRDKILTWCDFWTQFANMSDKNEIGKIETDIDFVNLLDRMNINHKTYNRFKGKLTESVALESIRYFKYYYM